MMVQLFNERSKWKIIFIQTLIVSVVNLNVVTGIENNLTSISSIMYGVQVFEKSDNMYSTLSVKQDFALEVFGSEVTRIKKAYFSISPDCEVESIPAQIKKESLFPEKDAFHAQFEPLEKFDSKVEFYFFCTIPMSLGYNSMVKVDIVKREGAEVIPFYLIVLVVFLFMSAVFSGLNLAIMGFGISELKMLEEYDEDRKNRVRATNVLTIRSKGNYVLITIIVGNVICNTTIALVIERLARIFGFDESRFVEVIISALQLVFTEILPAVFCTKNALYVASQMRFLVIFFMVLTFPLSYPLSKILNCAISEEDLSRNQVEMEALGMNEGPENPIKMENEKGSRLAVAQVVSLIKNTINLAEKSAANTMTPIDKVFMVSDQQLLTRSFKTELARKNHTRVPVYAGSNKNEVRGILNLKDLITLGSTSRLTAGTLLDLWSGSNKFRYVLDKTHLPGLMKELMRGFPMAIVVQFVPKNILTMASVNSFNRVTGIITLEDNLEEIVGEIMDEKDIEKKDPTVTAPKIQAAPKKTGMPNEKTPLLEDSPPPNHSPMIPLTRGTSPKKPVKKEKKDKKERKEKKDNEKR